LPQQRKIHRQIGFYRLENGFFPENRMETETSRGGGGNTISLSQPGSWGRQTS
jgi:hypothetical protein